MELLEFQKAFQSDNWFDIYEAFTLISVKEPDNDIAKNMVLFMSEFVDPKINIEFLDNKKRNFSPESIFPFIEKSVSENNISLRCIKAILMIQSFGGNHGGVEFTAADRLKLFQELDSLASDRFDVKLLGAVASDHYQKIITCLEEALKLNPAFVSGYSWLSGIYVEVGKDDESVRILDEGLKCYPNQSFLLYKKCEAFYRMKNFDSLVQVCEELTSKYPESREAELSNAMRGKPNKRVHVTSDSDISSIKGFLLFSIPVLSICLALSSLGFQPAQQFLSGIWASPAVFFLLVETLTNSEASTVLNQAYLTQSLMFQIGTLYGFGLMFCFSYFLLLAYKLMKSN